jgi:phosphoribosylanthranilate isomerase
LLAGGLTHENVASAIEIARPDGVDVSSGVCDDTKLAKDPSKVSSYVQRAQRAFEEN